MHKKRLWHVVGNPYAYATGILRSRLEKQKVGYLKERADKKVYTIPIVMVE